MSFDLEFERPLAKIEEQVHKLERRGERLTAEQQSQVRDLKAELASETRQLYDHLTPWQRVLVARHRQRPYTGDYIKLLCSEFFELRGDRRFADDRAILGGMASLDGRTVMILGHQKGRDLRSSEECNYGMPHPEGYRKALRLMRHAERLSMPVITFIDTQGAYPGIEDEARGQSQAIAENIQTMSILRTPIVTVVIGEGGSGGALAIGVADRVLMQQNTYYTVAAPEAASNILWRDTHHAADAAAAMKIGAPDLFERGLIDGIVPEPLGGAHRDHQEAAQLLRAALVAQLGELCALPVDDLLEQRYARWRAVGELVSDLAPLNSH
ncbi:MAG TPA: acetyl-CoA carboxylase carboxyltransferase subunit alpha [Ktedonobacterales bacterium]|jgi:acetyl-CoA carboxylase carboxyl transferase subunit alpha